MIPACKPYIWGGTILRDKYEKQSPDEIIAETWELSCHKDGASIVEGVGCTLPELLEKNPQYVGSAASISEEFPILIKLIDAAQDLSIQVHPDDAYALKNEGQFGKTEAWYVVDCEPGATLYHGFKEETDKETFRRAIEDNTICELLNKVEVQPGDLYFIEAGTIHAIGAGIVIAEIQQNSNVTYRVYDFGRVGVDGQPRELHVDKACEVTNYSKQEQNHEFGGHLVTCDYFTVDKVELDGSYANQTEDSFHSLLVTKGTGKVIAGETEIEFKAGDSVLVTADQGKYEIVGVGEILVTSVS